MRDQTPEEVYDGLATKGMYEEANLDAAEVAKVMGMVKEDFEFAKRMRSEKDPSWRVIFNAYYDVFRESCDQLMRFKGQKSSNHQGVFAFICLNFKELDLDWGSLELIRTLRNANKCKGKDISREAWKGLEVKFEVYISTVMKEVTARLRSHR